MRCSPLLPLVLLTRMMIWVSRVATTASCIWSTCLLCSQICFPSCWWVCCSKVLKGISLGHQPGGSGLYAQHLLAVTGNATTSADDCLLNLTSLMNFLLAGKASPFLAPWLCGAPLMALLKKNGGTHPIAIGEILHCLASSLWFYYCFLLLARDSLVPFVTSLYLPFHDWPVWWLLFGLFSWAPLYSVSWFFSFVVHHTLLQDHPGFLHKQGTSTVLTLGIFVTLIFSLGAQLTLKFWLGLQPQSAIISCSWGGCSCL